MVKAPRFSVVIPVFNRVHQLEECLRSVAKQTFHDFETIVVDDGSTEDVASALERSGLPIQNLRHGRNRGPGAARNTGIREAKGEYVAFLDSDDTWFPWTLATYDSVIRDGSEPSFVVGREASPTEAPSSLEKLKFDQFKDYYSSGMTDFWIGTCATAIRATSLREVCGFVEDRMNAEDSDLWLRLGTAPGFIQIHQPPVFRYHRSGNSLVSDLALAQTGIRVVIENEKAGRYPGSSNRRKQRRAIISRHVRPYVVARLRRGDRKEALELYRSIFGWLIAQVRVKFLLGFWAHYVFSILRRPPS